MNRATSEQIVWVSWGASGLGNGSLSDPYPTIQSAVDRATAATTILVREGGYDENVVLRRSGFDDAPIRLVSADGPGKAQIRPVDEHQATILGRGVENWVIKGFDIDGADHRNGIEFTQSGHDFTRLVRNIVVEGNRIHDVGIDGIKIAQAENVEVVGNLIIGGREEGIDLVTVWNSRIAQNEVRDIQGRAGIVAKGGSNHVVIEQNYVHDVAVDGIIVGGWTDPELLHLFKGYEASQITVRDNFVQGVEKRPLNFLAAQDSVATGNYLDGQNDYFTVVNIEGDNNGLVSRNLTIADNTLTRSEWLHIAKGHDQGHQIVGNQIGLQQPDNVGLSAYEASVDQPSMPSAEASSVETPSSGLVSSWALERAFAHLGDAVVVEHDERWRLDSGALEFTFSTHDVTKVQGLISKDAAYFGDGGHLSVWIEGGRLVVRLQDGESSHYVETVSGSIVAGAEHRVALSFGEEGMSLYLDGKLSDVNDYDGGLAGNAEPLVFGARAIYSDDEAANKLSDPLDGMIGHIAIKSGKALDDEGRLDPAVDQPSMPSAEASSVETPSSGLVSSWALERAFAHLGDAVVVEHDERWRLDSGALEFTFSTHDVTKVQGLISKDAAYFGDGGHLSVWIEGGRLVVRLQDGESSHYVETVSGSIVAGAEHRVALSFGEEGMSLYLDGKLSDVNDYDGGLAGNAEPLVFGARAIYSDDEAANKLSDPLDGMIGHIAIKSGKALDDEGRLDPAVDQPSMPSAEASSVETPSSGLVSSWALERAFAHLGDAVVVEHDERWRLDSGALEFTFSTHDVTKVQGLISKDAAYFGDGGHLSVWIEGGRLVVRLQDGESSHYVETVSGSIVAGAEHRVALSFGEEGMSLYLDGKLSDVNDYDGGLAGNAEPLVFGARAIYSDDEAANKLSDPLDGMIGHIAIKSEIDVLDLLPADQLATIFDS